ncbi:VOC family protein [Pseudomethylobacillus aquaticus]|uniref:Bleomycin resistance protein n=1 Tax=Pseudomethylobacillus aquaticus TaxID=2676064 RepID=A0A3N0V2N6_9PROT|nr:VOC family protein [Pseudomethylobacillus aquaticus]ROH87039.1 VOC family protein [Pseudomethylobacillus aquaticus]
MTTTTAFVSATPVLASLDIARSVAFFVEQLGFAQVYLQQGSYGIVEQGAVQLHFWACADKRIAEATGCRIRVDGIEALYARCVNAGIVHPHAPLAETPWSTLEFAILDPDGNLVTFHQAMADAV